MLWLQWVIEARAFTSRAKMDREILQSIRLKPRILKVSAAMTLSYMCILTVLNGIKSPSLSTEIYHYVKKCTTAYLEQEEPIETSQAPRWNMQGTKQQPCFDSRLMLHAISLSLSGKGIGLRMDGMDMSIPIFCKSRFVLTNIWTKCKPVVYTTIHLMDRRMCSLEFGAIWIHTRDAAHFELFSDW